MMEKMLMLADIVERHPDDCRRLARQAGLDELPIPHPEWPDDWEIVSQDSNGGITYRNSAGDCLVFSQSEPLAYRWRDLLNA